MRKARHERLVVGRDDNRGAKLVQFLEQVEQSHGDAVVDIASGLVGQQQARLADDRAGDGYALLLPARQGRRQIVEMLGEADPGQEFGHILAQLVVASTGNSQRQSHVLRDGEMGQQPKVLKHDADSSSQQGFFVARQAVHVAAEQAHASAARPARQIHHLQQR